MANIVMFHSVYGLRPAVIDAAQRLSGAGHAVTAPDLYGGEVVDDLQAGLAIRNRISIPVLLDRAKAAAAQAPPGTVYAGFSMGVAMAEQCAREDRHAGGLLLLHSYGNPDAATQPACPAQAHVAAGDPFATEEEREDWVRAYGDAAEVFMYPGGGHLFTDPGLPDYDKESADLTWQRVLAFCATVT